MHSFLNTHITGLFLFLTIITIASAQQQTYKACVVQVSPRRDPKQIPKKVPIDNLNLYHDIIESVKDQNLDIIVFPENGLTQTEPTSKNALHLEIYSVMSVDEGFNACDNQTAGEILTKLSCDAKANNIYIVFNAIERVKKDINVFDYYSTTFVLDKQGNLIKRYRKINKFNEKNYTPGKDLSTFEADFGVHFGLLTGSDILYKTGGELLEKDVSDVIYTTSLESQLPYFWSLSLQSGFALSGGVNLLASSMSSAKEHIAGSGIYLNTGEIPEIYHFDHTNEYYTIIQNIPITKKAQNDTKQMKIKSRVGNNDAEVEQFIKASNPNRMLNEKPFNKSELGTPVTLDDIKCQIKVKFQQIENSNNPKYIQKTFLGPGKLSPLEKAEESFLAICGITVCDDDEGCLNDWIVPKSSKFESIMLEATVRRRIYVAIPTTLRTDLTPSSSYFYSKNVDGDGNTVITMKSTESIKQEEIVSFGLFMNLEKSFAVVQVVNVLAILASLSVHLLFKVVL